MMKNWNDLLTRQRIDRAAGVIQRLCLLVMIVVELLFFLPGEAADNIVYLFLEWRLVDISVIFLAASCCRKYLRQSKWYFLLALLVVGWFYLLRGGQRGSIRIRAPLFAPIFCVCPLPLPRVTRRIPGA